MAAALHPSASGNDAELVDLAILFSRVALAAVFVYSGVSKLIDRNAALSELRQLGIPMVGFSLAATIAVQLLGSIALLSGIGFSWGAISLAGFTIVATAVGHQFWRHQNATFQKELTITLEHLAIVGGLILIAAIGPGQFAF